MARREDDDDDFEVEDASDLDADSDDETIPCPSCGKSVYEDAEWCPHCDQYISPDTRSDKKPLWIVLGIVLCLLISIAWIVNFH